jgi:hypothetical protein
MPTSISVIPTERIKFLTYGKIFPLPVAQCTVPNAFSTLFFAARTAPSVYHALGLGNVVPELPLCVGALFAQ